MIHTAYDTPSSLPELRRTTAMHRQCHTLRRGPTPFYWPSLSSEGEYFSDQMQRTEWRSSSSCLVSRFRPLWSNLGGCAPDAGDRFAPFPEQHWRAAEVEFSCARRAQPEQDSRTACAAFARQSVDGSFCEVALVLNSPMPSKRPICAVFAVGLGAGTPVHPRSCVLLGVKRTLQR